MAKGGHYLALSSGCLRSPEPFIQQTLGQLGFWGVPALYWWLRALTGASRSLSSRSPQKDRQTERWV